MMKAMALEDLINLMWTALEINRGSPLFYDTLEAELAKRVRGIKDDQFETLLACFTGDKSDISTQKFSKKFLSLVLKVVKDKKDRFNLKTLVQVIWSCARIDFTNATNEVTELLTEFSKYERLVQSLPTLYQKSQAILLWTYTRDEKLA
jgi:hypothetical protein